MCDRLPTFVRTLAIVAVAGWLAVGRATADDLLYDYEGDVSPCDESAGWICGNPCEGRCADSVENGFYVLRWTEPADLANYHYWVALSPEEAPPSLWVEWRFRSDRSFDDQVGACDGGLALDYDRISDAVYTYGDAAISFSGDDYVGGLDIDEFHTYRFESRNGYWYWVSADGLVFIYDHGRNVPGASYLQLGGRGGCGSDHGPTLNAWDFVRYGTISYGEQVTGSNPPSGFLDARDHAPLDRFTVTFDSPNYVYIYDVTVTVTGSDAPVVTQTRRRQNGGPETVEIVLDHPIPMRETTRFTFDDGVAVNEVEYTFAPGDTDGDGDADLRDFAAFQRCFGLAGLTGACSVLDFNTDDTIDLNDYEVLQGILAAP
jgi:hypothetical protein